MSELRIALVAEGTVMEYPRAQRRHAGPLNTDPTLQTFDAIVLHLDADVADFGYPDLRPPMSAEAAATKGWGALPCANPCPPEHASGSALHAVLLSWLNPALPGPTGVVCLPAMNTGAWLAAATLPEGHELVAPPCVVRPPSMKSWTLAPLIAEALAGSVH